MSETDINANVNVTEDVLADVDSLDHSSAGITDNENIVLSAEIDSGETLNAEIDDGEEVDVPVNESVGIAGDHRVLLHRDAENQHPMRAIDGLEGALSSMREELSSRISLVELENIDLESDMSTALLRIGELQDQVDGNIMTWFYAAEPSLNLPPVTTDPSNPQETGWDTVDKKNAHLGDLYYDTSTNYAYRFVYTEDEYSWSRMTDTDVTRALADAARAQDTADSKRRVFYTTPTPPYDKGDLWTQGSSGDIMVCNTSKTSDQSYSINDWERASKYTDDTQANIALASANGKNSVYHSPTQPTGGLYRAGDTWFDSDDGYAMYTYDGSLWMKELFGTNAIADASIVNAKIQNGTIEHGKIRSVDAGKITVGSLNADVMKANAINAVNGDTSGLTINAGKLSVDGIVYAINDDSTTTINGNKITTGTISASAIDATSGTFGISNIPSEARNDTYITDIDSNNGIKIHAINGDTTNYAKLNAYGLEVYNDGDSVAFFGATARVGQNDDGYSRTEITSGGMSVYRKAGTSDIELANIGYGSGNSQSGAAIAPYYTFGVRSGVIGNYSMAEGYNSEASGYCSHAEGFGTSATKNFGHAEGWANEADGVAAHAEGFNSEASGYCSHAEGDGTIAYEQYSHAEGYASKAYGQSSHAEGERTRADGIASHSQNYYTIADQDYQTAIGYYNTENNTNNLFAIGNGSNSRRSDAFTVDNSGNTKISGNATIVGSVSAGGGASITGDVDVTGSYKANGNPLIVVDVVDQDNISISANSFNSSISISAAKQGYTPIGIVGWQCTNGSSSGSGASASAIYRLRISGTNVVASIRNVVAADIKIHLHAHVLYVAS